MSSNLKDTLSTVCGVVFAIGTAILGVAASGVVLPGWLTAGATAVIAIAGGVLGFLTGKNPNLSTKSAEQVTEQNAQAK